MVDILKLKGIGLWLVAPLCIYLLTTQICSTIYAQEDKRFTNGKSSSSNEIHPIVYPTSPLSSEAFSENMSRSNISLNEGPSFSSSNPLFLKYNNLNNNHNKAGSMSFSDSRGSIDPPSSYMQAFPSQNTHPYYYPSYNYYPYSSGPSPYPPLASPTQNRPYHRHWHHLTLLHNHRLRIHRHWHQLLLCLLRLILPHTVFPVSHTFYRHLLLPCFLLQGIPPN